MGCKESEPKKSNNSNLKSVPVKRDWVSKKNYDLSKIVPNPQVQETFLETVPIKVRKLKPSYYEIGEGKITHSQIIGDETDFGNSKNRTRPFKQKNTIFNIDVDNGTVEMLENSNGKVLIVVPLEDGSKWIKEYDKDEQISQIVDDFKNENNMNLPNNIILDWKFNDEPLDLEAKIQTLIPKIHPTVFLNLDIEQKNLNLMTEENEDEENKNGIKDIAKPFKSPFEVYVFNKYNRGFQILNFDKNEIKKSEIDKYNLTSAYCNGNNHLFISGGENSLNNNRFWDIDLQTNQIKTFNLPSLKKNHSMIFVPNKYVFIVGGNDKIVYYFDTESKKINKWADLNEIHIEPSLFLYKKKDLYVFSNNSSNENIIFEKSDLSVSKPKFEKIEPKLEGDINEFGQKFNGVSLKNNNTIIFLGGEIKNNDNEFNFEYNIDENVIKRSECKFKHFNLREKTFFKYNKNVDFILTDFNRGRPEILFYKRNKNFFDSIFFSAENMRKKTNEKNLKQNKKYNFDMPDFDSLKNMENENNKYNFNFDNFNNDNNNNDNDNVNINNNFNDNEINNNFEDSNKFNIDNDNNNNNNNDNNDDNNQLENNNNNNNSFESDRKPEEISNNNNNNIIKSPLKNDNNNNNNNNNGEIPNYSTKLTTDAMKSNLRDGIESINSNKNNNNNNNDILNHHNKKSSEPEIIKEGPEIDTNIRKFNDSNNNDNNSNNNNNLNNIDNKSMRIINNRNNDSFYNNDNDDNNFEGNMARSSIIIDNSKGNVKKSELPLVNKSRNKIRSKFLGNSGIFDKNSVKKENLGKSYNVGISGKKI
jgi:hypothetical protein